MESDKRRLTKKCFLGKASDNIFGPHHLAENRFSGPMLTFGPLAITFLQKCCKNVIDESLAAQWIGGTNNKITKIQKPIYKLKSYLQKSRVLVGQKFLLFC